ncbi:putative transmembrane protein [Burkholderia sp. H160]|nr:putative transmembrane protein [Burkholderia sp. H160]
MLQEWLEYLPRLGWNTPITLTLTSASVGSVVTLIWIAARDGRERRRHRRDTSLELALSLESYARTCRTMMHKAAWAASEPVGPTNREASKGVSIPAFAYPDKLRWDVLSRRVISELREYPATAHAAREYVEAFREFGEPSDFCGQVEYECAKAARAALALARTTRRRHGAATWKPGAKDSAMERELADFIANAEEKRKESLERRTGPTVGRQADVQPFKHPLSA